MKTKTSTILKRAKTRLKGRWCQGAAFKDQDGDILPKPRPGCRMCALGAVWAAAAAGRKMGPGLGPMLRFRAILRAALPNRVTTRSVSEYNDKPGRTEEQILRLFDRAIKIAERQGD